MQEKRKVLKLMYSNLFLQGKNPLFSIRKSLENTLSGGFRYVNGRDYRIDFVAQALIGFADRRSSDRLSLVVEPTFSVASHPIASQSIK